ncbi:unnamed protein product [Trifolium pratense]|uniref:Uncharacterized protein n=1 Tax=Trifolium pratense TaxID=57577 RepID=A0ACB0LDB7_TRIPR|nr:unnamed protein product [Trifolium pratense]
MNFPNSILILTYFLFFFNLHQKHIVALATIETCLDTFCQTNQPLIRFPFHIEGKQAKTCGYQGFKVSCNENEKTQTLLNLPYMKKLKIQKINYAKQELLVNDPNNCLPKQLLSLNLSSSPFDAVYYQQFTFFNCSFNLEYLTSKYKPIACLSDFPKYVVFATPSLSVFVHLSSICDLVDTVNVPVKSPFFDQVLSSELDDDLRLSWNSPACGRCESHGGRCGFQVNSTFEIDCYNVPPRQGISRGASYAIAICVGVPSLLCFISLLSWICSKFRFGTHGWAWAHGTVADFEALLDPQQYTNISDYMPKETVKTMPECEHCFHAQCIDEWLLLNASCPICRTSPTCVPSQNLAQS